MKRRFAKVQMKYKAFKFQLDTGSYVTLINEQKLEEIWEFKSMKDGKDCLWYYKK